MAVASPGVATRESRPGFKRIAILRAGGLGDTIFLLPALDALRAAYPEAELTLIGGPLQAELFDGRPPIDRAIVLPPIPGVTAPEGSTFDAAEVDLAIARIAAERFDLAIQAHGGGRHSNALVRRFEAGMTVGCRTPDAAPLDVTMPHIYLASEVERWLEVVSLIGVEARSRSPRLALLPRDRESAAPVLAAVDSGAPVVGMHPGAGDPRRRWPVERFARVAEALVEDGCRVLLVGTVADRGLVDGVLRAMDWSARRQVLDACAAVSLGGLAALLERCDLFVGNDSGPLHLAAAVGTRTVGIYWAPNVINAGPPGRRMHRPQIAWRLDCPVCGTNLVAAACGHDASLVSDVPLEDVIFEARSLLGDASAVSETSSQSRRVGG